MKVLNLLMTASVLCLGVSAVEAATISDKKVVRSENGNIVRARLNGTCVRTDWQSQGDPCAPVPPAPKVAAYIPPPAPPPPPAPVVVQQRRDVLTSDEKIVYFNFNSAVLTPGAKTKLDSVASKLSAASAVRGADIVGYADRIGSNSYNVALSEKRAAAVHDYLAGRGYLNTQVAKVRGLGKSQPITHCPKNESRNAQIECLGADRRVELEVQYTKTEVNNVLVQPPAYAPQPAPQAAQQPMPAAYPVQGELQPVPDQGKVVYRSVAGVQ